MKKKILSIFLIFALLFTLVGCSSDVSYEDVSDTEVLEETTNETDENITDDSDIKIDGEYTSPEDVAFYIYTYGELPSNFITKREAKELGWDNEKGNLWEICPGKSIGGDKFGNYEGLLPDEDGRKWYECDVNYSGGYRNAERIVFSNDGLIYYTNDHYETFTQLY